MSSVTGSNFSNRLMTVVRMDGRVADKVQKLIAFAFSEYDINRNSNWLTDIMSAKFKSVRTEAIKAYIQDHTDLVWTKKEEGDPTFKREAKEGYVFTTPEKTWYEYSSAGVAAPFDEIQAMKSMINRLKSSLKDDSKKPVQDGHVENVHAMIHHLEAFQPVEMGIQAS